MGDAAIQVVCCPENPEDALFRSLFCITWRLIGIPGAVDNPTSSPVKKVQLAQERSGCCYGFEQGALEGSWERLLLWEC